MKYSFKTVHFKKRFPLKISRGTISSSENLFMSVTNGDLLGWGEMAPGQTEGAKSAKIGQAMLEEFLENQDHGNSIFQTHNEANSSGVARCALACLDIALWDLKAKKANMSLNDILGIPKVSIPTSLTLGINKPEIIKERIPLMLEGTTIKELKVKLGSKDGIEADKEMFATVLECSKDYNVRLRVDANGGWSPDGARKMMFWLAERDVAYVEQPLEAGQEEDLVGLFKNRPLPIFLDESCRVATDIPKLADVSDGINLKLMKSGGITEALRMVSVARALGLKTMIGCMGESSVSIAAGCSIGALFDFIDLDSHLNLEPDPSGGLKIENGVVMAEDGIGHGGYLKSA